MPESWHPFALKEIETAVQVRGYRLREVDRVFLDGVKQKIEVGFSLTEKQEKWLCDIHRRATDVKMIRRRF